MYSTEKLTKHLTQLYPGRTIKVGLESWSHDDGRKKDSFSCVIFENKEEHSGMSGNPQVVVAEVNEIGFTTLKKKIEASMKEHIRDRKEFPK